MKKKNKVYKLLLLILYVLIFVLSLGPGFRWEYKLLTNKVEILTAHVDYTKGAFGQPMVCFGSFEDGEGVFHEDVALCHIGIDSRRDSQEYDELAAKYENSYITICYDKETGDTDLYTEIHKNFILGICILTVNVPAIVLLILRHKNRRGGGSFV